MSFVTDVDVDTVLLVVSDSLRADVADTDLPVLDRLSRDSAKFSSFYTPGASTPSSIPGFVQSRLSIDHRGYGLRLPPEIPTTAELLSNDGIRCTGWHSNVYIGEKYGYDRGFDGYYDLQDSPYPESDERSGRSWRKVARSVAETVGLQNVAEQLFEQAKRHGFGDPNPKVRTERLIDATIKWLPDTPDGQYRFGYLHLMDTHLPYLPPPRYRREVDNAPDRTRRLYDLWKALIGNPEELTDDEVVALRSLYEAEARYVDAQLGRLVDFLDSRGFWDSTALLFTADHGELFRDREVPGKPNLKHPDYLCNELTHAPLVIAGGSIPDINVETLACGVDIAPTVASLFDVAIPSEWTGAVLDSDAFHDREYVLSALAHEYGDGHGARVERSATHVAVRTDEVAVLWWLDERHSTEYYRRTNDGEERVEFDTYPKQFTRCVEIAARCAERYTDVSDGGDTGGDVSDRLHDLGYIE